MIDGLGIAAIITASCGGLAAVIGAFRIQNKAAEKPSETQDPDHVLPPVPEKFDPDEVIEFLKEVRADNVDLRAQNQELRQEITGMKTSLEDMGTELKMALLVRDAFARWVPVLYQNWGKSATPPLPEGQDLITLRDFVPRT